MGRQLYTRCHVCGKPIGMGERMRMLRQRESRPGKWTETGWAYYTCRECCDAICDVLERLVRNDG